MLLDALIVDGVAAEDAVVYALVQAACVTLSQESTQTIFAGDDCSGTGSH